MTKRIYLAGPDVFASNAKSYGEWMKNICKDHGLMGLFPLDGDITDAPSDDSLKRKFQKACDIRRHNIELIKSSDAMIANMSPFRGPSMDVGTAYEMGIAEALGIPVIAYSNNRAPYKVKLGRYSKFHRLGDTTYADDGMTVEDFGVTDNLMVGCTVDHVYETFEQAVKAMSEQFYDTNSVA